MTRIPVLALTLAHLFACTQGRLGAQSPYASDPSDSPPLEVDEAYPNEHALYTASTGGPCDASLEHRPDNACDGEDLLGLHVVSVSDADGDARWEAGEQLTIELDFYTTREEGEDHVNYPRVFVDGDFSVEESHDELQGIGWFYALLPGDPIRLTYTVTATSDAAGSAEFVFTVGAMNCEGNKMWGACPTPNPLFLQLPVE